MEEEGEREGRKKGGGVGRNLFCVFVSQLILMVQRWCQEQPPRPWVTLAADWRSPMSNLVSKVPEATNPPFPLHQQCWVPG